MTEALLDRDRDMQYKDVPLYEGERIDDLQRNGYGIIQKTGGFCFGMDAVLLSGFAGARKGDLVVDLGTGTGIIPILMRAKTEAGMLYGLELQHEVADMAERSTRLNGISDTVKIVEGDIKEYRKVLSELCGRADVVTSNPPYMKRGSGLVNPEDMKMVSRHEICCSLSDVCGAASGLLRSGGHFYMVHRPLRLPEIVTALKGSGLEPKRLKFVHPYRDREANMVLIDSVKDGKPECRVEPPVIVYEAPGKYTREIYDIYGY